MVLKWLNTVPMSTLLTVATGATIATTGMGFMFKGKIINNVKETEFYKEAIADLRRHKGAASLLGEPIKDASIKVGDLSTNFTNETNAQYEVLVYGSKQKGKLYFWAQKEQNENKWIVSRIELQLDNEPYRRLLIKSSLDD